MSISAIDFLPANSEITQIANSDNQAQESNFVNWFNTELNELNSQIITSESKLEQLATGEANNLHDVMMSLEKAKLSFQLSLEVRNKLLEGYQEIMRMQI